MVAAHGWPPSVAEALAPLEYGVAAKMIGLGWHGHAAMRALWALRTEYERYERINLFSMFNGGPGARSAAARRATATQPRQRSRRTPAQAVRW